MRASAWFLLALLLALAACAGGPLSVPYADSTYDRVSTLSGAAKQQEVPLLVLGRPFDAPPGAVEARIAEIMTRTHIGPSFELVAKPNVDLSRGYAVVLLFEPAPGASGYALCQQPRQATAPDPERLSLLAAFCEVGDTMTYTRAWTPYPVGPDDPRFTSLIRQTTMDIFPPRRGDQNRRDPGDGVRIH